MSGKEAVDHTTDDNPRAPGPRAPGPAPNHHFDLLVVRINMASANTTLVPWGVKQTLRLPSASLPIALFAPAGTPRPRLSRAFYLSTPGGHYPVAKNGLG